MTKDEIILKKLDRLERLVGILVQDKVKVKWVKAGVIMKLTGWDREKMRRARNAGEVEFKKQGGFWYNPDSISPIYINKKSIA